MNANFIVLSYEMMKLKERQNNKNSERNEQLTIKGIW